jgi:hypothetical protein
MDVSSRLIELVNRVKPVEHPMHLEGPADGAALSEVELEELWQLVDRHVDKERAEALEAIRQCEFVYRYRDDKGRVRAMSCYWHLNVEVGGTEYTVLHGKWVIYDKIARGRSLPEVCSLDAFTRLRLRYPTNEIFLISRIATFNSYLLLARNIRATYPNRRFETPAEVRQVQDAAMRELYGDAYDAERGIFRGDGEMKYCEGAAWEPEVLSDPDIAAYLDFNPGQARGDTLVVTCRCDAAAFAEVTWKMLRRYARRLRRRRRVLAS